eukprot:9366536-Pyramimonas_sp.AAC.1
MAKKAFDFNSTVDSRRLSKLVIYHSAHGVSNILPNIRRIFPVDRLPHGWPTVDSEACCDDCGCGLAGGGGPVPADGAAVAGGGGPAGGGRGPG